MSSPTTIRKSYVDTPSGQLHYRSATPPDEPKGLLLLAHKSASSSVSFERLMSNYCILGYRCYAFDMPGFGASFDPSPSDMEDIKSIGTRWYVDVLMGAMKSLGITGGDRPPIHVLGHHGGACLALEMGYLYPQTIATVALVGASVMTAEDRVRMKGRFFETFNKPVPDGSHLTKTWDYLAGMGVGEEIGVHQTEALDHIRAWKGRNQFYGAVWDQDGERIMREIRRPVLAMCARDDVLWEHFPNVEKIRPDVKTVEISGANFSLTRDVEGIMRHWSPFIRAEAT